MLADEEKTYKELKDKADRLEFQKIFWARRDPDLATPENEFQARVPEGARRRRHEVQGPRRRSGPTPTAAASSSCWASRTRCRRRRPAAPGLPRAGDLDLQRPARPDLPGRQGRIAFDADCRAPAGFSAQLDRIAAAKVVQPNIDYRTGKDGRLVKLVDLLPKDTPARALFKQPRQDFPIARPGRSTSRWRTAARRWSACVRGDAAGARRRRERRRRRR